MRRSTQPDQVLPLKTLDPRYLDLFTDLQEHQPVRVHIPLPSPCAASSPLSTRTPVPPLPPLKYTMLYTCCNTVDRMHAVLLHAGRGVGSFNAKGMEWLRRF